MIYSTTQRDHLPQKALNRPPSMIQGGVCLSRIVKGGHQMNRMVRSRVACLAIIALIPMGLVGCAQTCEECVSDCTGFCIQTSCVPCFFI